MSAVWKVYYRNKTSLTSSLCQESMFLNIPTPLMSWLTYLTLSLFLSCSSLPWTPQDLRRRVEGQAAKEDVGHEDQPRRGLLSQVGLWERPVEVKRVWLRWHRAWTHRLCCLHEAAVVKSISVNECCTTAVKTTRQTEHVHFECFWSQLSLRYLQLSLLHPPQAAVMVTTVSVLLYT